jgi:hypothetical protein
LLKVTHFIRIRSVNAEQRLELEATAQAQHQVEGRLFLDVVVRQSAAVLELFAGEDQALLVRRDTYQEITAAQISDQRR